jgi:beta-aspartyl-dipeptidase (metallo-type)
LAAKKGKSHSGDGRVEGDECLVRWLHVGIAMLTLIEGGEVYSPKRLGKASVLISYDRISHVGAVDRDDLERLPVPVQVIDATGCAVVPGLIDPHEHLLGGSGEKGFSTQTPEVVLSEIAMAGITSVVGCLGVDTTMKTMAGLLAKVKGLKEEGLNAYLWSGGYNVPPTTIMSSIREDVMFIEECIGAGEIAIADARGLEPDTVALSKVVHDAYVGGMLSRKAGLCHFHVGDHESRLKKIRELIDEFNVPPEAIYLTHIERSRELVEEAVELTRRGVHVDMDTVEGEIAKWLNVYSGAGGDFDMLTLSSDTGMSSPRKLFEEWRGLVVEYGFALETVLPLVTSNTARLLKLPIKGEIAEGCAGDILIMDAETLDIRHVLSMGKPLVTDGEMVAREAFLADSDRAQVLIGDDAPR